MRIYDGSPRQDWEEVLRSIGAYADSERLKELLFLELEGGFLLQGLAMPVGSADSDTFGALVKRTYELTDDQVGEMMDVSAAKRGSADADRPHPDLLNYYELALRIIGQNNVIVSLPRLGRRPARSSQGSLGMKAIKVLLISIAALIAAMIVIPLTILAGLFVWLKLTEETDDEVMELDDAV